ncbi:MAG: AAA family ATPase [Deltaproteobacteria bacterium]|nr:AAA family ATPase [Deltaproteobacteria bacterium]
MYTRLLTPPKTSVFLFGPRGTGKSTWIRDHFKNVPYYDLLNTSEALRLSKEPGLLYKELKNLPKNSWVVIDEVQKVPSLLDEVHRLIEEYQLKFILSGSSARKLKKGGVNLLAGRARQEHLYPLVSAEMEFKFDIHEKVELGTLPISVTSEDPKAYLATYVETYLNEEIKAEALAKNIGNFGRFLEIAARQNGQVTNISSIARDAQVHRPTVQGYFDILTDTLIGSWLQSWKLKRATKQIAHPKFYFFDSGVVRALSGRLPYPPLPEETGFLLETFLANELRAYLSYSKKHFPLFFWSSHDQVEVDFFLETNKGFLAIECKASAKWDNRFNKGLNRIREELGATKVQCLGIYLGERPLSLDHIQILPAMQFLKALWAGDIIS